jgi:proteasome lid subunit RPN8/RPN11
MRGLSSAAKGQIADVVDRMFNSMAVRLVGNLPKFRERKTLTVSATNTDNLASLFVHSMAGRSPSEIEKDLLKGLLESASGFIDSLKSKTQSNIVEQLDGIAREYRLKGQKIPKNTMFGIIEEEMSKAKSHFLKIAEAESTKIRNTGKAVNIARMGRDLGQPDPNVFFQVTNGANACKYCIKNHLLEDKITPRVFKMSEVRQSYLSYEDRKNGAVSLAGSHPHCSCTLSFLPTGFGFIAGKISYISQDHDEYKAQKS